MAASKTPNHQHPQPEIVLARNDLAISKSYFISTVITNVAQGSEILMPLNNVLNPQGTGSVIFTGMETVLNAQIAFDPQGNPIVSTADAPQLSITLVWEDVEFIKDWPYLCVNTDLNYGMIRRLNHVKIDLTKSYIKVVGTSVTLDNAAGINFYYMDAPEHHKKPATKK